MKYYGQNSNSVLLFVFVYCFRGRRRRPFVSVLFCFSGVSGSFLYVPRELWGHLWPCFLFLGGRGIVDVTLLLCIF